MDFKLALLQALRLRPDLALALPGGIHSRDIILRVVSSGADRSLTPAALLEIPSGDLSETLDGGPLEEITTDSAAISVRTLLSLNNLRSPSAAIRAAELDRESALAAAVDKLRAALTSTSLDVPGWRIERLYLSSIEEANEALPDAESSTDLFTIETRLTFGLRAVRADS